jgi:23S rRNA pseudouridine2605 synthase
MRINQFVAKATGLSRRAADKTIAEGRVIINGKPAETGAQATTDDIVTLDNHRITPDVKTITIMLNKPPGFVVSREGQGSKTIYDLLPPEYHQLKPIGRLDKDSSGLLLLTNDGKLAHQLTHPRYAKTKISAVGLDNPLEPLHPQIINDRGIQLKDGLSKLALHKLDDSNKNWQITMSEGRNRQIRRTFDALGYKVIKLHRTCFGSYRINDLAHGVYKEPSE